MTTPILMRFDVQDDGSLKVRTINSNLSEMKGKLDSVGSQASIFTRAMDFIRGSLTAIHNIVFSVTGALAGLGVGLTAASFVKTASDMEGLRVRMQLLTGSVEEGNRMFGLAAEYAEKVTYEYLDIANAAVSIRSALNTGTEETMRLVQIAGDVAARSGMAIQDSAGQIVRMWSAGTGAADQFRERGVLAMLGFKAGVTYSVEETRKKLIEAWEDPTRRIKGAAEGLGGTFKGVLSMISDEWTKFQLTLMEGGLFDAIKASLEELRQSFGSWLKENTETVKGWGKSLANGFKDLVGLTKMLADNLWIVRDAAAAALVYMTGLATVSLAATISSVVTLASKIGLMGAIFTTLGITVKGLVGFLVASGVGAIIAGIAASAYYIVTHVEESTVAWGYFMRNVRDLWSYMKEGVTTAGTYLGKFAADAQLAWERTTGTIKALWNGFVMDMKKSFYNALEEVSNATEKLPGFMDAFKFKVSVPEDVAAYDSSKSGSQAAMKAVVDKYLADQKATDAYFSNELKKIHADGAAERTKNLLDAEKNAQEVLGNADNPVIRGQKTANAEAQIVTNAATEAGDSLKAWNRELSELEARYSQLQATQRLEQELDDKRVKLGQLSELDALNREYDRRLALLDLDDKLIAKELQIARAASAEEIDQSKIQKLLADQKAIAEERLKLPILQQLDQEILKREEIKKLAETVRRDEEAMLRLKQDRYSGYSNDIRMYHGIGEPFLGGIDDSFKAFRSYTDKASSLNKQIADTRLEIESASAEHRVALNERLNEQLKLRDEESSRVRLQIASNMFKGMGDTAMQFYEATGRKHDEYFKLWKAMSIAETIVSTYASAVAVYKSCASIPVVGWMLAPAAAATAVSFGMAQVAMIAAQQPPKMHNGGRVQRTAYDLQPDEVVRTLRVNERVLTEPEAEDYERGGSRSSVRPAYRHETVIYNVIDQNMILAPMASQRGRDIIVNHIGSDFHERGPIRSIIKSD